MLTAVNMSNKEQKEVVLNRLDKILATKAYSQYQLNNQHKNDISELFLVENSPASVKLKNPEFFLYYEKFLSADDSKILNEQIEKVLSFYLICFIETPEEMLIF